MSELCLVTGGAGFIGSHLVETLLSQGRSVRVFDNFSTGLSENLARFSHATPAADAAGSLEIMEGDLGRPEDVDRAVAGASVVFHLGAVASVQRSVEQPTYSHQICGTGTLHVLDAARRLGVRRVVYAASSSAYGVPIGPVQKESDPIQPLSPYAAGKLTGEMYATAFAATYGLETVSLRFFNIFGPRQRDDSPYTGVIALFARAMAAGTPPTVHGDGLQTRDFTYVANVVQALLNAADASGVSGKVFNIGMGKSVNLLQLIGALNGLLGTSLAPKHGPPRAGDVRHSRADITSAQRELGYEPDFSFEAGLKRTLRWYRERA